MTALNESSGKNGGPICEKPVSKFAHVGQCGSQGPKPKIRDTTVCKTQNDYRERTDHVLIEAKNKVANLWDRVIELPVIFALFA